MKKTLLTLITLAIPLFAAQPKTVLTCTEVGKQNDITRIKITEWSPSLRFLSVEVNSTLVFQRQVIETHTTPDRAYFKSGVFTNENDVPSMLQLQTWEDGSRLVGEFSEVSYLPQIKALHALTCTEN